MSYCGLSGNELPPITEIHIAKNMVTWTPPEIPQDVLNAMQLDGDEQKEQNAAALLSYQLCHRRDRSSLGNNEAKEEEAKQDNDWTEVELSDVAKYEFTKLGVWEFKVQYRLNRIFTSLPSEIKKCQSYIAKWSAQHKGDRITLSENNTKALMAQSDEQCVRAEYPITKGMLLKLDFIFHPKSGFSLDFIGVVSSEFTGYQNVSVPYRNNAITKYSYGADCCFSNSDVRTKHYFGEFKDLGWTLGDLGKETKTIQMLVDYASSDTCCLSFYVDGQLKGPENAAYSMKLPPLTDNHAWYPAVGFWNTNKWCIISCAD